MPPHRTHTRNDHTVASPPHPIADQVHARKPRKGAKNPGALAKSVPPELLAMPTPPALDDATRARLHEVHDPRGRVAVAADYIMAAWAALAPPAHIEQEIGIPQGSLLGHLLADRELTLRMCHADVAAASLCGERARALMSTGVGRLRGKGTSAYGGRAVIGAGLDWAREAEARRRRSEATFRKSLQGAEKDASRGRARLAKLIDFLLGSVGCTLPPLPRELRVEGDDPLSAAQQLLPQLQQARDESIDNVRRHLDKIVETVERYVALREGRPDPAEVERERASAAQRAEHEAVFERMRAAEAAKMTSPPARVAGREADVAAEVRVPADLVQVVTAAPAPAPKVDKSRIADLRCRLAAARQATAGLPATSRAHIEVSRLEDQLRQLGADPMEGVKRNHP